MKRILMIIISLLLSCLFAPLCNAETEPVNDSVRVFRIAGDDRYDTSVKIADEMKKKLGIEYFDTVVLHREKTIRMLWAALTLTILSMRQCCSYQTEQKHWRKQQIIWLRL